MGEKRNLTFRNFKGVNTQAERTSIQDGEFAWLENIMPIGDGNARTLYAPSAALYTLTGDTCYYMAQGNISGTCYMFMLCISGNAYAINLSNGLFTATQFGSGFATNATIAQWKNERILIFDGSTGLWDWDGTTLTGQKGTVQSVSVTFGGSGFTNANLTTLTPSSGSATFSCTLGCNLIALHSGGGGSGYAVNDVLTLIGGTFTYPTTLIVTTVSSGAITGFNLNTTGIYTVPPGTSAIGVTGGHGTGATFDPTWGIYAVTVTNPGSGYSSAPIITVSGSGSGTGATFTPNLGVSAVGNIISVYASRVWLGNKRTVLFSAPDSYYDFNPADAAGSYIITDSTTKSNLSSLYAANNYLYEVSSNSISVISNVAVTPATTTSAAVTTFSRTLITDSVGTEMPQSVISIGRSILFGVDYGIHALTGSTPDKVSSALDGIFPGSDFTQAITAGMCVIFNIMCVCFLLKYNDPAKGTRALICVMFNGKWFFASQGDGLIFIASAQPDPDVPHLYGTDGTKLYELFNDSTANISQTFQTKFWDAGQPVYTKQVFRIGLENTTPAYGSSFAVNVDTEAATNPVTLSPTGDQTNQFAWTNATGQPFVWTNNSSVVFIWYRAGFYFLKKSCSAFGKYFGVTMTSSTPGLKYNAMHLEYEITTPW